MKNWMKNIICSREWIGNGSGMDRAKSRIDSFFHSLTPDSILCRFCLASLIWIIIGGFSTRAWALGNTVPTNISGTWYSLYDCTEGNGYQNDDSREFDVVAPTKGTLYYQWKKSANTAFYNLDLQYLQKGNNDYSSKTNILYSGVTNYTTSFNDATYTSLPKDISKIQLVFGNKS